MSTPYGRRATAKAGGRKTLSSRLGFRYGRSSSGTAAAPAAVPAAAGPKSFVSASSSSSSSSLIEPRNSGATSTSGESETSTLESSPAPLREPPRETRPLTVAVAGAGDARNSRCRLVSGGDEAEAPSVDGTGPGQVRVAFEKDEFSSTGGKALGLTVSPAKGEGDGLVPTGARIDRLPGRSGAEEGEGAGDGGDVAWPTLKPGDLLADINGQDVRRLPFSEVLRLLNNGPTPHVITTTSNTTTTIGRMFGSDTSNTSSNSNSSSHPHPHHPGNAAKKLRGTLSAASVGPRTPGSNSKTAPPSTSRSLAPPPPTPPSPAVLAPLSPRRIGSIRTPRPFAPLLTDVRRVSWCRKNSSKWGGGGSGGGGKDDEGKAGGGKDEAGAGGHDRPTSAAFFSSPAATPTNASSFTRAASLNPWGGGTPGGKSKPTRLSRTRAMLNTTFGRLSPRPRVTVSPRPAVSAFKAAGSGNAGGVGNGNGKGNAPPLADSAEPPAHPSPASPSAVPPSPAGSSPEKVLGVSPKDVSVGVSPVPSASTRATVKDPNPPSPSPTTPRRTGRQELLVLGAAAAAKRRGSNLRFPLKLEGDNDSSDGLVDEDGGGGGEKGKNGGEGKGKSKAKDCELSRQASRESMMSSSSAFFPSDTESGDEGGARKGEGGHADEEKKEQEKKKGQVQGEKEMKKKEQQRGRLPTADKDKDRAVGSCKLNNGQSDQGTQQQEQQQQELDKEVPLAEQEEEEIVALSSYLASARRGWPWMGQNVLWAEYVSLNGHHRWVRSEQCRHALLLVRGALYLLELPKDAVARHKAKGPPTRARGSWYMQLNAADVSHLSVPLTAAQPGRSACGDRFEAGSGLVLHKRGGVGACAWVECRNAASRDALVDLVRAWAKPDATGKGAGRGEERPLSVELRSVAQLASGFAGGDCKGRRIPSLTDERLACPLW